MASSKTDEDQEIRTIICPIYKDPLQVNIFSKECRKVLEKAKSPSDKFPLKLEKSCPSYEYRKRLLKEFVKLKSNETNFSLGSNTERQFREELEEFIHNESCNVPNGVLQEIWKCHRQDSSFDGIFANSVKRGVVVCKSENSVCIHSLKGADEYVVKLDSEFPGHGIGVKIGDVLGFIKTERQKKVSFETELICCYQLEQQEIHTFLKELLQTGRENGPLAALIELVRSNALWEYILGVPHGNGLLSQSFVEKLVQMILEICDEVCSMQDHMSETVKDVWKKFGGSKFLEELLPDFARNENCRNVANKLAQNFLKNFLQVCPEYVIRVLPIVRDLTTTAPCGHGSSAGDFPCQLLAVLAPNVSGVSGNIEALSWNQQPLILTPQELHIESRSGDLPKIKVKDDKSEDYKYSSEEEYLHTYFTLMREECFHKLKNGIQKFLRDGEFDAKTIMIYSITLFGIDANSQNSTLPGLPFVLKFKQNKVDLESTSWLLYGDLLCISLDATFKNPIWGLVSGSNKNLTNNGTVHVTLCSERNSMTDPEVISELQRLTDEGRSANMAESNTFYRAFGPSMDVLQHKDTVPFKDYLVDVSPASQVPRYIKKIDKQPEWKILFQLDRAVDMPGGTGTEPNGAAHVPSGTGPYSLVDDFRKMRKKFKSELDETQLDAVEQALTNEVVLIQGPPGTGKSYVGVALVNLLLSIQVPGPILVVTYKNFALDHFLKSCLEKIPQFRDEYKLIRVGRGSSGNSDDLYVNDHNLYEVADRAWMPSDLYKYKRRLKTELMALEKQVQRAYDQLRQENIFSPLMFVKEADGKQIRALLNDCHNYDKKTLENLINHKGDTDDPNNEKNLEELTKLVQGPLMAWLPSENDIQVFAGVSKAETDLRLRTGEKKAEKKEEDMNSLIMLPSAENKERQGAEDMIPNALDSGDIGGKINQPTGQALQNLKQWERKLPPTERLDLHFKSWLNVGNILELKLSTEKICLMYAIQQKYYNMASQVFMDLVKLYTKKKQERKEVCDQHYIEILKDSHVIGMTVTAAAIRAGWLASIKPSVMIVEEAAEILEAQLVSVIPSSVQHLIMIGDHQQLRPQIHYDKLRRRHNMDVSLFERLIKGGLSFTQLKYQGRMRKEFADLVRELQIYDHLSDREELIEKNTLLPCVQKAMFFCSHNHPESSEKNSPSYFNTREATEVTDTAKYLCAQGVPPSHITVLCSYRGQVDKINKILNPLNSEDSLGIEVTTIDSFQGRENEVILLSLVRNSRDKRPKIGYLSSKNRLCVAISRARRGLYLFGNDELLKRCSKWWRKVIEKMKEEGCVGKVFPRQDNVRPDGGVPSSPGATSGNRSPASEHGNINYYVDIHAPVENLAIGTEATVIAQKGDTRNQGVQTETHVDAPVRTKQETNTREPSQCTPSAPIEEESVDSPQDHSKDLIAREQSWVDGESNAETQVPRQDGDDSSIITTEERTSAEETGDIEKVSRQETEPPKSDDEVISGLSGESTRATEPCQEGSSQCTPSAPIEEESVDSPQDHSKDLIAREQSWVDGESNAETQVPRQDGDDSSIITTEERTSAEETGDIQKVSRQETEPPKSDDEVISGLSGESTRATEPCQETGEIQKLPRQETEP